MKLSISSIKKHTLRRGLCVLTGLTVLSGSVAAVAPLGTVFPTYEAYAATVKDGIFNYDMAYQLYQMVNALRAQNGLKPYGFDQEMQTGALIRSAELSILWDHMRPNGQEYYTICPKSYGENNGMLSGFRDTASANQAMLDAWMNSPMHRGNILSASFQSIAVAVFFEQSTGTYYIVQEFGNHAASGAPITSGSTGIQATFDNGNNPTFTVPGQAAPPPPPTQAPTQAPTTVAPTTAAPKPTPAPTTAAPPPPPTVAPTQPPTQAPTLAPTTAAPTQAPTQAPTTVAPTTATPKPSQTETTVSDRPGDATKPSSTKDPKETKPHSGQKDETTKADKTTEDADTKESTTTDKASDSPTAPDEGHFISMTIPGLDSWTSKDLPSDSTFRPFMGDQTGDNAIWLGVVRPTKTGASEDPDASWTLTIAQKDAYYFIDEEQFSSIVKENRLEDFFWQIGTPAKLPDPLPTGHWQQTVDSMTYVLTEDDDHTLCLFMTDSHGKTLRIDKDTAGEALPEHLAQLKDSNPDGTTESAEDATATVEDSNETVAETTPAETSVEETVAASTESEALLPTLTTKPASTSDGPSIKTMKRWLIIASAIVLGTAVLAVILLFILVWRRKKKDDDDESGEKEPPAGDA